MTRLSLVLTSAVLAAGCGGAPKPQPAAPAATPAAPTAPAPGGSRLMAGLDDHHHPIRTSNAEAQKFFDQGMSLTLGFNDEAAIRAFQHAAELDPKAAMPYWGEAWAPGTGHIVHMPAHIYGRTGDHAAAANANAGGAAADVKYLATAPPDSMYGLMYYSHNLQFLSDSQMMQGRFADAREPALLLATRLDPYTAMMPMVESIIVGPVSVLLRFNKHDDILKLPAWPADRPVQIAWNHFARGVAFARTGKLDDAAAERAAFAQAVANIPESALWGGGGFTTAHTAMDIATIELDARIASARQQHEQSIQLWQRAVAAADKLPYDEPPDWYYPMRESLGAALLMADKPAEAERVFREDLDRNPRNPRSLFGLQAALAKQGKNADAAWVQREFEQAWKNADTMLTIEGLWPPTAS